MITYGELLPVMMIIGELLLLGIVVGMASGFFGIGGGIILIPGLVLLFGVSQRVAQGVSLAVIIPTALAGAIAHYRQRNVRLDLAIWIVPTALVTAVLAANFANAIDVLLLRRLFALLLISLSFWMLLSRKQNA